MSKRFYLVFIVLITASLACSFSLGSLPGGKIVYQSDEYGNNEIFAINPTTRAVTRLTNNSSNEVSPTYISALKRIGFVSDQNKSWNLFSMDMNGDDVQQIIDDADIRLDYPEWSPDGAMVAASLVKGCTTEDTTCMYELYVFNADGSRLKKLSDTVQSEWLPAWSPDGSKIAFMSDRDGDSEIYVIEPDGFNLKQLTDNDGYDGRPRWSPDGSQIAFESDRDGGDWDLFLMDASGRNVQAVTKNSTNDFSQSWSPDGKWFVYLSDVDGNNEIYIIDVKGENQRRLTENTFNDIAPIWVP